MADAPVPSLALTAIEELRRRGLVVGGYRVHSAGRQELVRSSVLVIDVVDERGETTRIYHKQIKPRAESKKADVVLVELRETLTVAAVQERYLVGRLEEPTFRIGETLAADPETLEQVTLGVPGDPLGRLWRRSLTSGRREEAGQVSWLVGRACREIEEVGGFQGDLPDRLRGDAVVDRRLARVEGVFSQADMGKLDLLLSELEADAMDRTDALCRSHGDLNSTNVLVHEHGVGLIDFAWLPRLRLTDLAHFAYRLEYESGSPRRFAKSLIDELVGGYGRADVVSDPAWKFLRYSKLIRVISSAGASRNPLVRRRSGWARQELSEAINSR